MGLILSFVPIVVMRRSAFAMFRRHAKARFHSRYALQRYRHGKGNGDQEAKAAKHAGIVLGRYQVFQFLVAVTPVRMAMAVIRMHHGMAAAPCDQPAVDGKSCDACDDQRYDKRKPEH